MLSNKHQPTGKGKDHFCGKDMQGLLKPDDGAELLWNPLALQASH